MAILVDHSNSMNTLRMDGVTKADGTVPSRCFAAGLVVPELLQALQQGDVYDITKIDDTGIVVSSNDAYDTDCPNVSNRLVSIRVFSDLGYVTGVPAPTFDNVTASAASPDGFVTPLQAFAAWQTSKYWDSANNKQQPAESCNGNTPLAQGMCTTASDFPLGLPAPGDLRQAMILTDGGENTSVLPGCRNANTDPVDPGAQGSGGWGDRVTAQFTARGIEGHGFLFAEGAQRFAGRSTTVLEPQLFRAIAAPLAVGTTEQMFFQSWASQTRGGLTVVSDTQLIAPSTTLLDTDGDGVPDFRDFCPFGLCVDTDRDQIPDSMDACIISQFEDGKGPFPADGCSDFDADGVRDGFDQCPTAFEDYYPPKPNDGCPRPIAAPAMSGIALGVLGFGLLGLGFLSVKRSRKHIEES